jgi:HTH-type transcriptional regulator / antitoxin HigA
MAELKYPVIKSRGQYNQYCNFLEGLLCKPDQSSGEEAEIELLTTLIEVWDSQHSKTSQLDPIQLLKSLMKDHKLTAVQLMKILGIRSRGHIYEILGYQKGLSKSVIRKLSEYFKVSQEAFNRAYMLKTSSAKAPTRDRNASKASRRSRVTNAKAAGTKRLQKGSIKKKLQSA